MVHLLLKDVVTALLDKSIVFGVELIQPPNDLVALDLEVLGIDLLPHSQLLIADEHEVLNNIPGAILLLLLEIVLRPIDPPLQRLLGRKEARPQMALLVLLELRLLELQLLGELVEHREEGLPVLAEIAGGALDGRKVVKHVFEVRPEDVRVS